MKKCRYTIFPVLIILAFRFTNLRAQVNMGIQLSAGSLDMEAPYNNYRIGYQGGIGVMVFEDIKWIKDLAWESGLKLTYGHTGYYP